MAEDFTRGLLKTLAVLRPYYMQIVIGGGWAPFLYYRYLAQNREHTPVLTRDIDFMVRHQVPLVGPKTIDEILTEEAKLTTAFKNLDNPPVIHYEGTVDGIEVEIEFLTDQTGSQEEEDDRDDRNPPARPDHRVCHRIRASSSGMATPSQSGITRAV